MAIAFDNSAALGTASAFPASFSYTVNSNTNGFLLVAIVGTPGTTGVTYNGVALTRLSGSPASNSTSGQIDVWYLVGPAQGTNTLTISASSGTSSFGVASYTGVASASPEATAKDITSTAGAGSPAPYTINPAITTLSTNAWIVTCGVSNATWSQHSGTTLRQTLSGAGSNVGYIADQGPEGAAGSYTTIVDTNFNGGNAIASLTLSLAPFTPASGGNSMSPSLKIGLF
jgi:hypothetical protein